MTTAADNPFSPPKAEVRDAPATRLLAERPKRVVYATALLWISFAIGVVAELFPSSEPPVPWAVEAGTWAFIVAVATLVNMGVWRGRHWARVAHAVLEVLGIFSVPLLVSTRSLASIALNVVSMLLGAVVLYQVFTKPGSLWFKYIRDPRM
jgi:hypothetical protein